MAITKTYINGNLDNLYNWLTANATDYFTNFVKNSDSVSCYVGNLEFLKINPDLSFRKGIIVTTSGGVSQSFYNNYTGHSISYAYKTSNAIVFSDQQNMFSIVISKDNNDNVTILIIGTHNTAATFVPTTSSANTVYCISTVSEIIQTFILYPNDTSPISTFCPMLISGYYPRYMPNVYYMPFGQYTVEGKFLINDVVHFCNGIIAVKDE